MKFDVIVGNPPYQESDGGHAASATPIYTEFVNLAKSISPYYISIIMKSNWMSGDSLKKFRNIFLNDSHIKLLSDYPVSNDIFKNNTDIKGGVCYFLWDKSFNNNECLFINNLENNYNSKKRKLCIEGTDALLRFNNSISIFEKVNSFNEEKMDKYVTARKPFGLDTSVKGDNLYNNDSLILYGNKTESYISRERITDEFQLVDKYKIFISYAYGAGNNFPHQILNKPIPVKPKCVCSETYICIGPFNELNIDNVKKYIESKFFRFMVLLLKNTQHATQYVYKLVPVQDFTQHSSKDILENNSLIDWSKSITKLDKEANEKYECSTINEIDAMLYKKYGLDKEEVQFIEKMIKPMK